MNLYNCDEITFSYTKTSFEELKGVLEKKANLDSLNQLSVGEFDFMSVFESDNMKIPQVYRSENALKALFFPCQTTQGTVMVCNIKDGWETLRHQLSGIIKHGFYSFRLDGEKTADVMNSLTYSENMTKTRVVYSMTDPQWKFYQRGDKLWFEDESYYNNRIIRKRMNKIILTEYCKKLKLDIDSDVFWNVSGETMLFTRCYK
ncbi:hypothetical protein SMW69_002888 [Salmonella enterica]|uniref:hypothetical protein n=1 Tax=Salmonella enterica TaxID=28901 RepID=UPI0024C079E6|nr:hypothetical protein [Salmonella enterica]EAW5633238.1 hypothetical protein [Salmonella enterica]ELY3362353.1 hypothetical protein [Salmonella enterica]WHW98382.1 hypothetical protein QCX26_15705 [Salmonella enterica subsp. enterica]